MFSVYERAAFGELTGGFWIPLVLLLMLSPGKPEPLRGNPSPRGNHPSGSLARRILDGSTAPLALVVAGCWLSNAPLGVMACYLLAAVALAAAWLDRSWAPLLRAALAAVLGMGLAAIYLVPAAWEQRWVDIHQAIGEAHFQIENSWLFKGAYGILLRRCALGPLAPRRWHYIELFRLSMMAVAMFAAAFGAMAVCWRRGRLSIGNHSAARRWWIPLALIPPAILFLQLPISLPVWNLLPKLRFLQFSWRWLVVLEAPMAIFFAWAVWPVQPRRRIYLAAASTLVFVAISVAFGTLVYMRCDASHPEINSLSAVDAALDRGGMGVRGVPEYTSPPGASNDLIATGLPDACLVSDPARVLGKVRPETASFWTVPAWEPGQNSCEATYANTEARPEDSIRHRRIAALIPHPGYLILRLRSYPAWQVKVNGRPISDLPRRGDGLMAVPVPRGPVDLSVDWTATADVILGRWLSAISVLLLAALCLLEWKFNLLCPWLAALR
jgi:hypothetical protein